MDERDWESEGIRQFEAIARSIPIASHEHGAIAGSAGVWTDESGRDWIITAEHVLHRENIGSSGYSVRVGAHWIDASDWDIFPVHRGVQRESIDLAVVRPPEGVAIGESLLNESRATPSRGDLKIAEETCFFGYPGRKSTELTTGHLIGLGRWGRVAGFWDGTMRSNSDFLIDAPALPGNSGAPVWVKQQKGWAYAGTVVEMSWQKVNTPEISQGGRWVPMGYTYVRNGYAVRCALTHEQLI